jgi:rhodanese-related sulfurtransferase
MDRHVSARLVRLLATDGRIPNAAHANTGPDVIVCSAPEAARLRPSRHGVVIALRDPGSAPAPLKSGWGALLPLEVPDVDVSGELPPPANLEPLAEALAEFVIHHRDARRIVLHCHLGVSRSRSTAAAICETFEWPYRWTVLHEPLYHAVGVALRRRLHREAAKEKAFE